MTEWSIVTVIIALIGLIVSVTSPIVKLNTTITKLTQIVDAVGKDLADLTDRNSKSHARIYDSLDKHDNAINNHETRIVILEKEIEK